MADFKSIGLKSLSIEKLTELLDVQIKLEEPGMIAELFDDFIKHCGSRPKHMHASFQQKDFTALRNEAHSMKSAAGNLGGNKLSKICETIETAIDSCKNTADAAFLKLVETQMAALGAEWVVLEVEIQKVRKALGSGN